MATTREEFSPRYAACLAALIEREELLSQEVRGLAESSYRRRCAIEGELAEIRRLLEQLGLRNRRSSTGSG
jgi:hypothetical protein